MACRDGRTGIDVGHTPGHIWSIHRSPVSCQESEWEVREKVQKQHNTRGAQVLEALRQCSLDRSPHAGSALAGMS